MQSWLHETIWMGNSAWAWLLAGAGALIGYLVVFTVAKFVAARFRSLARRNPQHPNLGVVSGILDATRGWILLLLAIDIALRSLPHPVIAGAYTQWALVALIGMQAAFWVAKALLGWLKRATPDGSMQNSNPVIFGLLTWAVELLVWSTLLLVLMAQANVHIGAFVASLGVGGIAIAMAAKNMLEDLLASITIGLDKPFEVGDFIGFGTDLGTVRKVGIKTTRIESLSGEELIIGNSLLQQSLIHNYNRRQERRVLFGFNVPLDTPRDKVTEIPRRINALINSKEMARLDRGHFAEISDAGFRFEFVYFVLAPGYAPYAELQQTLNLEIMDLMADLQVPFALPARVVHTRDLDA